VAVVLTTWRRERQPEFIGVPASRPCSSCGPGTCRENDAGDAIAAATMLAGVRPGGLNRKRKANTSRLQADQKPQKISSARSSTIAKCRTTSRVNSGWYPTRGAG
jgi:hypothetical protein